ncbi:MAP1S protein, partial [Climacteris rufus]|nr:MAP1S protein [Climacteris rufus]
RPGRRSDSPHDVDLCLVSPCEFEHPKSERSPSAAASPRELSDSDPSQELAPPRGRPGETPPTACDPLPAPLKAPCPLPAQPGICMVDPEALPPGRKEPPKVKRTPSRVGSAPAAPKAE